MPDTLLTAKLNAYGFRLKALRLMNNSQRNQRTKINEVKVMKLNHIVPGYNFFFWSPSRFGVKIYFFQHIYQWFFLILNDTNFASYADDNNLYKICENTDAVAETLRMSAEKLFKWFKDNQIKESTDSFYLTWKVQEIQVKSKLEIHWLKAFSVWNSLVLNLIIISFWSECQKHL